MFRNTLSLSNIYQLYKQLLVYLLCSIIVQAYFKI